MQGYEKLLQFLKHVKSTIIRIVLPFTSGTQRVNLVRNLVASHAINLEDV
jgi:hypothetical protein